MRVYSNNSKIIIITLIIMTSLFVSSCSLIRGIFKRDRDMDITLGTVEELRLAYINGEIDALEELIAIYEDGNQSLDVRVSAVRILGESRHPMALQTLTNYVREAEALELDLMVASVDVLGDFKDDPKASEALLESIFTIDEKLRGLQTSIFKSIGKIKTEDQILALLDIYEQSRAAFYNTAMMVSKNMGQIDRDEVIPVLVFLANDKSLDIKLRNRALNILAQKKNDPEVVEMFVEMLTDPSMEAQIREFALRTMKDVKEEQLILALLDTYNQGQKSYYSLLNTLMDALGNFDDPAVKPTLIQIALSDDIPRNIRIKAISNLGNFKDPAIFIKILPLLEERDNYEYYIYILELAYKLDVADLYKNELKKAAFIAQEKALEEDKKKE